MHLGGWFVNRLVGRILAVITLALGASAMAQDPVPPGETPAATPMPTDAAPVEAAGDNAEYYELYKVFADTLDQVERNYVKDVSRRELMEAAIRGLLDKLDPYSNYISPNELGHFKTSVEHQFGGIGILIDMTPSGRLVVVSPLVGSPAYVAGIQSGDWIVEIEGRPTQGMSRDDAVKSLKGEAGTQVTLTVVRPRAGQRRTLTITRDMVQLETVMGDERDDKDHWDFMLDDDRKIGYVRLTSFGRDTPGDLQKAMELLDSQGMKGLVLDLRFNPGGLLNSAVEIADLFVAQGRIVSTRGRNTPERTWDARKPGTFDGFPLAVLVNRYSASASEIVSACLQDHGLAIVVGERTWGKGSVQNVIELEEGKSALKLTTASYLRPNGHNIHRFPDATEKDEWGVVPSTGYEIRLSDAELEQLVRHRHYRDLLLTSHSPTAPVTEPAAAGQSDDAKGTANEDEIASRQPASFDDRQLKKALEYLGTELAKAE